MTRVPNLRKWFIRSFTVLLVLAVYGETAVGNQNIIKVAEATECEGETFVFHEITETRRELSNPKRHRERCQDEIDSEHAQPDFSRYGRFWFVKEHFRIRRDSGPSCPPRAPSVFS